MNSFLPLFPLQLVCFPSEKLNLHIFEPRYKTLVHDCIESDLSFGIIPVINNELQKIGTEVKIANIQQTYPTGELDINTVGIGTFSLLDFQNPMPEKPYAGCLIKHIETYHEESGFIHDAINIRLQELYNLLKVQIDWKINTLLPLSYQIAHKIGLSLYQEYELLIQTHEAERQSMILDHLNKVLPILAEMEKAKERIKLTGHFKHLDSLNF
jgi:Lon protease-like protein